MFFFERKFSSKWTAYSPCACVFSVFNLFALCKLRNSDPETVTYMLYYLHVHQ